MSGSPFRVVPLMPLPGPDTSTAVPPITDQVPRGVARPGVAEQPWQALKAANQPLWPDREQLAQVQETLASRPPLIYPAEARRLRSRLGDVSEGRAFLLQAGDCAESFRRFDEGAIRGKLRVILQMAVILSYSAGVPVVKLGRLAGQFAKPRSSPVETIDGRQLPSFFGHMVNDVPFTEASRTPDPQRLLQAYDQAAATLNLLRSCARGGFADLHQVQAWNQSFVADLPEGRRYAALADEIGRALRFMDAAGLSDHAALGEIEFYTSHEALILEYEDALTRVDDAAAADRGGAQDRSKDAGMMTVGDRLAPSKVAGSAHMLWIGERTRALDGAHVAWARQVANPIGCKLGPTTSVDEVLGLCATLNPERIPGRLTLITRLGAGNVERVLPDLIEAVRAAGYPVVWVCDPMHGNTFESSSGHKTRRFDDVLRETRAFFEVHRAAGSWPGGLHVELTGEDVTECLGGSDALVDTDLGRRYETICDPRLNARQSIDLAFAVSDFIGAGE